MTPRGSFSYDESMRKTLPIILVVGLVAFAVPVAGAGAPSRATVAVKDFSYSPSTVTIKKGGAVTWVWQGRIAHNVVADRGAFRSPLSNKWRSKKWSKTFTRAGTFTYYCEPHPSMRGKVVVR